MNATKWQEELWKCGECGARYGEARFAIRCCSMVPCGRCKCDVKFRPYRSSAEMFCDSCTESRRFEGAKKLSLEELHAGDYQLEVDGRFYDNATHLSEDILDDIADECWGDLPRYAWVCKPDEWEPNIVGWLESELETQLDLLDDKHPHGSFSTLTGLNGLEKAFDAWRADQPRFQVYYATNIAVDLSEIWAHYAEELEELGRELIFIDASPTPDRHS